MTRAGWALVATALIACKGGDDSDGNNNNGADPNVDLTEGLARNEGCETVTGSGGEELPAAGATRYYVGSFDVKDDNVSGYEYLVLLWTELWKEQNPEAVDCKIAMSGTGGDKVDPIACGSCEFAISLTVEADAGLSDCDADFTDYMRTQGDYGTQDLFYNVFDAGGGEAHLFFESGSEFTNGGALQGDKLTYVTESTCVYSF